MHLIPFVKSNSTTEKDTINTTTSSIRPSTTNDNDLGIEVAGIYASIVSSSSAATATVTKDHHPSSSLNANALDNVETKSPIYCTSCDLVVRDPAHFHGTAHLVSIQSKPPPWPQQQQQQEENEEQDQDQDKSTTQPAAITRLEMEYGKDRAMQLMRKQGWRYGQGLGKANQGAPYPMTTVWKQDRLGIGHPRTDRRRITHPSISKTKTNSSSSLKNPRLVNGKKLAADAKAEANLRTAMLHYMNH